MLLESASASLCIDDGEVLRSSKFACEYRATTRAEITDLLLANGCSDVKWLFPEETGFYLNETGNLVINFNEAEVAPACMGMVEFEIPKEVIADIRK